MKEHKNTRTQKQDTLHRRRSLAPVQERMKADFCVQDDAAAFPLYNSLPVDKAVDGCRQNSADWAEVLKQYRDGLAWCASEGSQNYQDRHKERGLLLGTVSL